MTPNQLARQYLKISKLHAKLDKMKKELRDSLIASGAFENETYKCTITHVESEYVESLEDIRDKSEKLFNALHTAGCVKIKSYDKVTVKKLS